MRLDEFQFLSEDGKGAAAKNGRYLTEREIAGFQILLYAIDEFYVEVYRHYLTHTIAFIDGFRDTERLEPYLAKIKFRSGLHPNNARAVCC